MVSNNKATGDINPLKANLITANKAATTARKNGK